MPASLPLAGAMAFSALALAYAGGIRVNASNSMPVGLWAITQPVEISRGEAVTVCGGGQDAPRYVGPGDCPSGLEPLVKPIAAVAGDIVTVTPDKITVNGRPVDNSRALRRDEAGRALRPVPLGSYVVAPETVWLLSSHDPRSYDSRYFGPVPLSAIQAAARPLLVLP